MSVPSSDAVINPPRSSTYIICVTPAVCGRRAAEVGKRRERDGRVAQQLGFTELVLVKDAHPERLKGLARRQRWEAKLVVEDGVVGLVDGLAALHALAEGHLGERVGLARGVRRDQPGRLDAEHGEPACKERACRGAEAGGVVDGRAVAAA